MKRIGWLFCAVALLAANVVYAEEGSPPVAPLETEAPLSSGAPAPGVTTAKSPTKQGFHDVFANTQVVKTLKTV